MYNRFWRYSSFLLATRMLMNFLYTRMSSFLFESFGRNSIIGCKSTFIGVHNISIGNYTRIGRYAVVTAWNKVNEDCFTPKILIGDNCSIGEYVHITAINSISIGNNVLMGRRVTISDNSHGENISKEELQIPPILRKMHSKGGIFIEDNVWIGDKATILAGVRIGYASIIGANSVVTKDIPPYSIVGGIPAKILRIVK